MNASAYLDTRSILVVVLTMTVLMGLVSLAFGRLERGMQALRLWGWSLLVFAVGMGLVALRGKVPDLVGILIGDTVLLATAIPMLRSVRRLNGEPAADIPADIPGWVLLALGFALIAFWTLVTPDTAARIVVFSAIVALQYFRIAYHLFNSLPEQGRSAQVFTAAVIACFSASWAARVVMTLMAGKVDEFFQPSHVQSLSMLAYAVFMVAATLGVMWMALQAARNQLAASEWALREAQRVARIGNWTLDLVTDTFTWSDEICRIFETDMNSLPTSYEAFLNAVHPEDRQRLEAAYANAHQTRSPYQVTYRLLLADGRVRQVEAHGESTFDGDGKPLRSIGTLQDVSDRLRKDLALRESEERFRTIADYTFGWEYWLGTNNELLYVNAACERISGYSPAEFAADPGLIKRIVHPDDGPVYNAHLHDISAERESHIEFRIVSKTGEVCWIAHGCRAVLSPDGRPLGRRISNRDITELKNAEEYARQLAFFDSLTNLPNRRMLLDRLNLGLSQARRFGRNLAVMFLDLDNFKEVNDTLGHDVGDSLLLEVAKRLTSCVRAGDTVARAGGDEFIIVLPEIADAHAATVVAEKILKAIRQPIRIGGNVLDIAVSVGIAVHEASAADNAAELMKKADIAMYQAKQAGRNGFRLFEEAVAGAN